MMDKLLNWYWEYGIQRGQDYSDPDHELRKMTIDGWLDPLVRLLERRQAIQSQTGTKACLAIWGPSQSGKSTMISHFVDGQSPDGSDSALTWSAEHRTRFSPPEAGQGAMAGAICFNPWNHKSDASGIATRYTLRAEADGQVDPDFPIEIKLSNRTQLILAIALGYLSECEREEETINYTQERFLADIQGLNGQAEAVPPSCYSRDAYLLLHDMANVMEFMRGHDRFSNLFRRGEWDRTLRKALVSSPAMLSNIHCAEQFLTKLFWDGSTRVTRFYRSLLATLNQLQDAWRGCRILTTMEVGSLLLDIDSFSCFASAEGRPETKQKVAHLTASRQNGTICIYIDKVAQDASIAGNAFGNFQAVCAELVVPLRKEAFVQAQDKQKFLSLLESCDFLDFPGVSNKNTGNAAGDGNAAFVHLGDNTSDSTLLTSVFKQGKTQCFVYNYVRKYGIDAFAILVRTDSPSISNSSLLNAGVKEWLCSFDPHWQPGSRLPMPVFLNMTFFASLLNNVSQNGTGKNGLMPYVTRLQELNFVRAGCSKIFATTYQQFFDGKIANPGHAARTVSQIMEDPVFAKATGLTDTDLQVVYEADGGLGHMYGCMSREISVSRRQQECQAILKQDQVEMVRLLESQLPSKTEDGNDRKEQLKDCIAHLHGVLNRIEDDDDDDALSYDKLAHRLNALFSISSEILAPLPQDIENKGQKIVRRYLKEQVARWHEDKIAAIDSNECLSVEQSQVIIACLRDSVDASELIDNFIIKYCRSLQKPREANEARRAFALALGNCLRTGKVGQSNTTVPVNERNPASLKSFIEARQSMSSSRASSPYYRMVIEPLMNRLEKLVEYVSAGQRPPQPGDDELRHLLEQLL